MSIKLKPTEDCGYHCNLCTPQKDFQNPEEFFRHYNKFHGDSV